MTNLVYIERPSIALKPTSNIIKMLCKCKENLRIYLGLKGVKNGFGLLSLVICKKQVQD